MTVLALAALGAALLVLPGFGLRSILRRPHAEDALDELELAVGATVMAMAAVGALLVAFEAFSATRIAVPLTILALVGIPRAAIWVWPLFRRPATYVLAALTAPWVWSALRDGYPPAGLFQWYYWDLGRALSTVHGIPSYVREFGEPIRWLPDYLVFNFVSEAYRGASIFGSEAQQLVAFRIPIALLGIVTVYGVLKLWLRTTPALFGAALVVPTLWFTDKFNTFKPESYAILLGLIAVRLAVNAVRRRDVPLLLFVGVLVGLNLGVHAIGALITGMLLAGAVLAELLTDREARSRRTIGALVLSGVVALALTAGTGAALQGRALVIGDASKPVRLQDGTDPTYLFLERNSGHFGEVKPPSLDEEVSSNLQEPWDGLDLTTGWGLVLSGLTIVGIVLGLTTRRRVLLQAVIAVVVFSALLAAGVLYFATSFDTFVPRHTGLGRFVQYSPLVFAMLVAIALEGVAVWLEQLSAVGRQRIAGIAVATGIVVGAVGLSVRLTVDRYQTQNVLPPAGKALLEQLARQGRTGESVLTNAGTRGIFEFWTGMEDPLEARQALIENPKFVNDATALLEDTNKFFTGTGAADLPDRLGLDWIVVSPAPSLLGAGATYGHPPAGWTVPGFVAVPARDGIVVWHRDGAARLQRSVGPAKDRQVETLLLLAGVAGVTVLAWAWASRRRPSASPPAPSPDTA